MMLSRHDDRARTKYGSHSNCRTIQIVAWNYRRVDVPTLVAAPIGPPLSLSHDPTAAYPPTPIRADVKVAPAAQGLHDEEVEMSIFLDRERIASAAWMPLLLSKHSPRQRERRELQELRGGGLLLLSAITDERKERV